MEVSVRRVDPRALGDADLEPIYRLDRQLRLEPWPEDGFVDFAAYAAVVRGATPESRVTVALAEGEGEPQGLASVSWQEVPENRHLADLRLFVRPEARRRGLGALLLREAAAVAEDAGRSLLIGGSTDRTPGAEEFARAVGAEPALVEHENRLELARLDRDLLRDWRRPRPGYRILAIDGVTPPELADEVARVVELMNDAPRGDIRAEDWREEPERMIAFEATLVGAGHRLWTVYPQHEASGRLVGFTRVSWHPSAPALVHQWGTAIAPEHRGHGLGRLVKATLYDWILRDAPLARRVSTTNATSNKWMLAINRDLGFEAVSTWTHWQVDTSKVRYTLRQPARPLE